MGDLQRWAKRYGVPFQSSPFSFVSNTLRIMRGAVASQRLGVFGAPTFFVGDEMFWGNDRLDFVESALERQEE